MKYDEYLYANIFYMIILLAGLAIVLTGIIFTPFSKSPSGNNGKGSGEIKKRLVKLLNTSASAYPLKLLKARINKGLEVTLFKEENRNTISSVLTLFLVSTGLILAGCLFSLGQFWYSKLMLSCMGLFLPYYMATLLLDLYRYRMIQQIPKLIDEFRGSFIRHNKIRPALKECSGYIDRGLGRLMSKASDSVFLEDNLDTLKQKFNNVWFNIFVVLILNFKENGGELIDQLYRLNRTITRHNSIERKKGKRLIWYEVFAVGAAVLSIPAIFWMNGIILGQESIIADVQTNMMISQVMAFSALSLVIVRILRKM